MRILDGKWSERSNIYLMECDCMHLFEHRADRWIAECSNCHRRENIGVMRKRWFEEHNLKEPTDD